MERPKHETNDLASREHATSRLAQLAFVEIQQYEAESLVNLKESVVNRLSDTTDLETAEIDDLLARKRTNLSKNQQEIIGQMKGCLGVSTDSSQFLVSENLAKFHHDERLNHDQLRRLAMFLGFRVKHNHRGETTARPCVPLSVGAIRSIAGSKSNEAEHELLVGLSKFLDHFHQKVFIANMEDIDI